MDSDGFGGIGLLRSRDEILSEIRWLETVFTGT